MKVKDHLFGFEVINIREVEDLKCMSYEFVHKKTKAKLLWLDRDDDNKTFCIGFKTTPNDDTGVFHILEHSVLNGSDKYPLKEPFVELLKGSLATFLNAITFPDKTIYPVASKNEKDFMNLMDVYLDAVFHPLIYKNPNIFYQEGWHHELYSLEDKPIYKGVVYNEMKGAMSSINEIIQSNILKQLFPDTIYKYNSGGDPKYIPELTYEQFIDTHKTYYHPSNSYIILDGNVPLNKTLERIDTYLSEYEYEEKVFNINLQKEVSNTNKVKYEISESETLENKTHYAKAKIVGSYKDKEKLYAISLINEVLAGNNESVLVKNILENNLGNDVIVSVLDDIKQPIFMIEVRNSEEENIEKIKEVLDDTIKEVLKKGLSKEDLTACLNRMIFSHKSQKEPRGIYYIMSVFNGYLYDDDPLLYLRNEEMFTNLRNKINTEYYDELVKEIYLDGKFVELVCIPTKEKETEEDIILNEEEKQFALKNTVQLEKWQNTFDTKEQLMCLPQLTIEDVKDTSKEIKSEYKEVNGVKVLTHEIYDNGIVHVHLYFNIADLDLNEIKYMRFISSLYGNVDSENYDVETLQRKVKTHIGRIAYGVDAYSNREEVSKTKPYFVVSFSSLESELQTSFELVKEILLKSKINDKKRCKELLNQYVENYKQAMIARGDRFGVIRCAAHTLPEGVIKENCGGYEYYLFLKSLLEDENLEVFFKNTNTLLNKVFVSERLTMSLNTNTDLNDFINSFEKGNIDKVENTYHMDLSKNEAIIIPSEVSYAVLASNANYADHKYNGSALVLENLLTFDYLWNKIRVQGGAYGTGALFSGNGNVAFTSFRDPSGVKSIEVYKEAVEYIRNFVREEDDIEKFIIGALQGFESLLTPLSLCKKYDAMYFSNIDISYEKKIRNQVIHTNKEDLLKWALVLEKILKEANICIVSNKKLIDTCTFEVKVLNL